MNKKVIFIAIGTVLVIVLAIVTYAYSATSTPRSGQSGNTQTGTQTPPPGQTPTPVPTVVTVNNQNNPTVFTTAKGTVRTSNFAAKPIFKTETTLVVADADQYQIVYLPAEHSFEILIAAPPANMSRNQAENAFLKLLNVSQTDACKLPVVLKVPYAVDKELAGPEYGLSFCNPAKK